jgi:erythromycin esterase-like protein
METGFCGLLALNRYMLDNGRPIDSLLNELDASGMYGIYYTREVYRMLLWLKAYNMSQAESHDKIQLFGIDMQDPYSITGELLKRLPELPSANTIIYQRLTELHKLYYPRKEVKMSKADRGTYERLADDLGSIIRQKANIKDTTLLLHLATLLKQTLELRDILARSLERGKVRNQQYMEARDKFMADNVIWIKENYGSPDAKLMLWAHNGHIAHASLAKARRMGYYLKERKQSTKDT